MNRHFPSALAAALMICTSAAAIAAQPVAPAPAPAAGQAEARIVADSAVRFGTLANGLHYAVMQNHSPAGAISVRLAMDLGSYEEEAEERGYAHYIEHLAFRSTRIAPNGVLDDRFARLGIALGRDQNAFTGLESTVYTVDLPTADLAGLNDILEWMRSGAEDILFTPAAVDGERGVLLAELQSRRTQLQEAQREITRFQAQGLRSADREPGGTEASLAAATPARLKAFYDRWYRPENATLVVVGDAPVETLQQLVERQFAGWRGRGAAGVRPQPPARLPERGTEVITVPNPAMAAGLSACRLAPKGAEPEGVAKIRRNALSGLWSSILRERLKHASSAPGSPLLGAMALVNHDMPDARATCLVVAPVVGKWKEALAIGQAELRRFAAAGPTDAEIAEAKADLLGPLYGAEAQQNSRMTAKLASDLAAAALDKRVFQSPQAALATSEAVLAPVTKAEVAQAFASDWSGAGPLLAMAGPVVPPKESLLAAWQANESAAPLAAYADRETAHWLYDFGKPGKVRRRESFSNPEFVRVTFKNGVILNFRHSDLEAKDVEIRVRFGGGAASLTPDERGPALIGSGLFPAGGLGKMDFEQIGSVFANTNWRFTLNVPTSAFLLSSSTLSEQTQDELTLLAAYMTDPGFRPTIDEKLPTAIDFAYRYLKSDPSAVAVDALERATFAGMSSLPPQAEMEKWHAKDFERIFRPALTQSPIEVTIVGDLTEQQAIAATAASFGALPARRPPTATPTYPFRRFPEPLPAPITATHFGPTDKSAAILMWPLYDATVARRKEEYALALLASIFQSRLIQQVRVKMGKVYSPAVATAMPDNADQGFLAASLEVAPADADSIILAAKAIAAELASGAIGQDDVDKARQPMVAARLQAQSRNGAWASILSESAHQPAVLDELLAYPRQMAELSLEDVRRAAATWLKRDPIVVKAVPASARKP